jgi:Flp pilus assembly protein TadG
MRNAPHHQPAQNSNSRGAATVELTLVLPILLFVFVAGADFSRAFYFSQVITESAYRGAQYASDSDLAALVPYGSVEDVVMADLQNLDPPPSVDVAWFANDVTPTVRVTVSYQFRPIVQNFGLLGPMLLQRSAQQRLHPSTDLPDDGTP